jgi:chitin disaccharide deacetylase
MEKRRLIINADDLGVNAQRSHGIFQCVEFGVVTNTSLYPNGTDSDAAAKHARERKVSAGLHLNLTDEYPLSKPEHIAGLVEMNGTFLGERKLREALEEGSVPTASLEREVRAQLDWFFDTHGSAPTHIDGHRHVHLYPAVADVLIELMERYGIMNVRIPCEEPLPPFGYQITDDELAGVEALNARARAARDMYCGRGLRTTDHFRGLTLAGNASLKNLRHIIGKLPEGTTELMVHPGSACTYGTPFDLDPQRQTELRMLLDESIRDELAERKIQLVSWADV